MESSKYPTMRFELTGVTPDGAPADTAAVQMQGRLTLHGVTRDVTLPGRVWKDGDALRLRSDFPPHGPRKILTRPRRDTTTVREAEPRVKWKLALDKPVVMPRGEKVRSRGGPARVTPSWEGPGEDQCGSPAPTRVMRSVWAATERIAGRPWTIAVVRARR
jgi:hypothetical protein